MSATRGQVAARIAVARFVGMKCLQALLDLGSPLGHVARRVRQEKLPPGLRVARLFSIGINALGAVVVLEKTGILSVPNKPTVVRYTVWFPAALLGLSAIGNLSSSSKSVKRVMTPLALTLSLMCVIVAITSQ